VGFGVLAARGCVGERVCLPLMERAVGDAEAHPRQQLELVTLLDLGWLAEDESHGEAVRARPRRRRLVEDLVLAECA
jgi:hypothetical protein